MRLSGFARTETRNHRKHSEKFLKNAKNINLLKMIRILLAEIQAYRGAHCLHFACQGGGRSPLPPRQLRHWSGVTAPLSHICN